MFLLSSQFVVVVRQVHLLSTHFLRPSFPPCCVLCLVSCVWLSCVLLSCVLLSCCLVSCVLCLFVVLSCVLCVVSCVWCLLVCYVLSVLCCVLCVLCCVFCHECCVLCVVCCFLSVYWGVVSDLASNVFCLRLVNSLSLLQVAALLLTTVIALVSNPYAATEINENANLRTGSQGN